MEGRASPVERVAEDGAAAGDLWAALGSRLAASPRVDLWRSVAERLDLGGFVPAPSVSEAREVTGRGGTTYRVLRSPTRRYIRLDEEDAALWSRMDGRRSVREIATAHFLERGSFAPARLARLVCELRAGGFLGPPPIDVFGVLSTRLAARKPSARLAAWANRVLILRLCELPNADRAFGAAYSRVGWLAYTRPATLLWSLLIAVGLLAWGYQFALAEYPIFQTNGSYTLGLITLAILDVVGVNLGLVAQALTVKHQGRSIDRAALVLYSMVPVLEVETTDAWMAERRRRLAVSWSGPCTLLLLGSLLALLALPLEGTELGAFVFKGATIWLANALFSLLPILNLDGYFLLEDYLDMPSLRANSVRFLRSGLAAAVRTRRRLTRDERIWAAYGLFSALLLVLIPVAILEARDLRYAATLRDLWNSPGPLAELQAVAMTALLLGPAALTILRQLATALLELARLGARGWQRWRGRVPGEYVQALAGLPFLRDVPRRELVQIARHLRPRAASAGQVLVSQGGYADEFFLIRSGTVRVEKLTADGGAVLLARLGAGDYFGETALVERVPRTAEVVAETDVRLLVLDAGHFGRWMAGRPRLSESVRRGEVDRERLADVPILRGTDPAELERLAARLLVTRYSAGDEIVREGDHGDRFYFLLDGRVEVAREAGGKSSRLAELEAGDYFGEMALLDDRPRSATVRALTPVEAYSLAAADFRDLLQRLPEAATMRATAADRRRTIDERERSG